MQKISLAINAVLLIAVGVLFFLYFSLKKQVFGESSGNDTLSVATLPLPKASGKIMYINVDSLQAKYDYFLKIKSQLERKGKANEAEIKNMYSGFQATYQKYQQQAQTMTEQQYMVAQQDLANQEKNLRQKEELIGQNYAKEAAKLNDQYLENVTSYLKRKGKDHNYSYVLTYTKEIPSILYVNDSLDITTQVVKGLNAEFKASQSK